MFPCLILLKHKAETPSVLFFSFSHLEEATLFSWVLVFWGFFQKTISLYNFDGK